MSLFVSELIFRYFKFDLNIIKKFNFKVLTIKWVYLGRYECIFNNLVVVAATVAVATLNDLNIQLRCLNKVITS